MSEKKRFAFIGSPNVGKSALLTISMEAMRGNKHAKWLIKKMNAPKCRGVDCLECRVKDECIPFDFEKDLEYALKNTVVVHPWGSGEEETKAILEEVLREES